MDVPDIHARWPLIPVIALFYLVALLALVEIVRNYRAMKHDADLAASSSGWEMRRWFHAWQDQDVTCPSCKVGDGGHVVLHDAERAVRRWHHHLPSIAFTRIPTKPNGSIGRCSSWNRG